MARLQVGGGELGDGGVHLLDVVQRLGRHPGLGRGLGHELVHRPLLLTGVAPGHGGGSVVTNFANAVL